MEKFKIRGEKYQGNRKDRILLIPDIKKDCFRMKKYKQSFIFSLETGFFLFKRLIYNS
jgi:hypothetical protein